MNTDLFDYHLPESAVAQVPIEPRDAARLLRTDPLEDRRFCDLEDLLHPGDLVVVNQTKVRAARLIGHKPATGGAVELLLLRRIDESRWEALIRPARRIRVGSQLEFGAISGEVISEPVRGEVAVKLTATDDDIEAAIAIAGEMPLPPYIHTNLEDPDRYQTVFAKRIGSAAAPTAALHFTPRLLEALAGRGVELAEVNLEVGLDTFRPIDTAVIDDHEMHTETWSVPPETAAAIGTARQRGGRVVAVGTTVVRTLETAADDEGTVREGRGATALFISPGYRMKAVDAVLTNFHAPRTTLIVMIATLLGDRWREVYEHALANDYRFLSFGDAMLIEKPVNSR
ncbi:MAG: tRNA preQ1(34) S-adenosylmethionine ribosyltransferase-isomerase QueA [bacterium]|nr:tRNA preQ1(34) S-adenosylmethionine ribosyltransferase-isomerase QueA [bacterium]